MGGGKSSTTETENKQEVDKDLVKDYGKLTDAGAELATMRTQPNRNVTVADFTPAQKAAFENTQGAGSAFGMATPAASGMPTATASANGIMGFSTAPEHDAAVAALPDDYKKAMESFYNTLKGVTAKEEEAPKKKKEENSMLGKLTGNSSGSSSASNSPFA